MPSIARKVASCITHRQELGNAAELPRTVQARQTVLSVLWMLVSLDIPKVTWLKTESVVTTGSHALKANDLSKRKTRLDKPTLSSVITFPLLLEGFRAAVEHGKYV